MCPFFLTLSLVYTLLAESQISEVPTEWIIALVAILLVHLGVAILQHVDKFYLKIKTFQVILSEECGHQKGNQHAILLQELPIPTSARHSGKGTKDII